MAAFVSAVILTGLLRKNAVKTGLLDHPNRRSSHAVPTPRGGGLSIVLVFVAGLWLLCFSGRLSPETVTGLAGGGVMTALVGWVDDHGNVPPLQRLLVQLTAAAWAVFWLGAPVPSFIGEHWAWSWLWKASVGLAMVWMINLNNFMDGIDGIAGVETIFVSLALGGLLFLGRHPGLGLTCCFLAAATAGFLVWNWPPARIFMGDVGSGFIGFALAAVGLASMAHGLKWPVALIILLCVFEVDATVTLLRRMARGATWYQAHREHAYQHAAQRWGHRNVTLAVLAVNVLWLLPLAAGAILIPGYAWLWIILALSPLFFAALKLGAGRHG